MLTLGKIHPLRVYEQKNTKLSDFPVDSMYRLRDPMGFLGQVPAVSLAAVLSGSFLKRADRRTLGRVGGNPSLRHIGGFLLCRTDLLATSHQPERALFHDSLYFNGDFIQQPAGKV